MENNNDLEFIVAVSEHRSIGNILSAFLLKPNEKKTFKTIETSVNLKNIDEKQYPFSQAEKRIVTLIDNYSDDVLYKKFSRKQTSKEFFEKMDEQVFNEFIVPYIDKQIIECIDIVRENNIKMYTKVPKYSNFYDSDEIIVLPGFTEVEFNFEVTPISLRYYLSLQYNGNSLRLIRKNPIIITDTPCRMVLDNKLYCFENFSGKKLSPFSIKDFISVPKNLIEKYYNTFVLNAIKNHTVNAIGFDIINVKTEKRPIIVIEQGLNLEPALALKYKYGSKQFNASNKSLVEVELINQDGKYTFFKHQRDIAWEKEIVDFLAKHGLKLSANQLVFNDNGNTENDDPRYAVVNWVNTHFKQLNEKKFEIKQTFPNQHFYTGYQSIDVSLKTDGDWFDVRAIVKFGDYSFPFVRLRKYILKNIRLYELPNGETVVLPIEWFTNYKNLFPYAEIDDENLRFEKHHFKLLKENLRGIDTSFFDSFDNLDQTNFELIEEPKGLKAKLRDYQKVGFSWMYYLSKNKFGGCLADDMGLGKTVQTLAVLLKLKNEQSIHVKTKSDQIELQPTLFPIDNEPKTRASLIILPTSLVHNWENEIKKFTPELKVHKHIGVQRKQKSSIDKLISTYDIILTTYGTIRNDYTEFSNEVFNYLILDESQYIKNSESKTYNAVCELKASHKLVITGTPIENSLSDLWSQVNFLNPRLLGTFSFFKKEFILPIEKMEDEEKQKQLQHLIQPFILRRKKEAVAKDLPPLTEQIRYCEMLEEQHSIYETEKSAIRNNILNTFEKVGIEKSTFLVLQGLTRLRQLANHPAMVGMDEKIESGKFNEIIRSLDNLIAENHKVLLFSTFVKHLKLFEKEFQQRGWEFCLLTGQTHDRQTVITEFQTNPKKQIFLISLKAGGVGLNLTAADYIFIVDPWWNPAAESQAVSRAHRIGQNKKVMVYRFISEGTIEEKIIRLQSKKNILADKFINNNNPIKAISKDEIMGLFD